MKAEPLSRDHLEKMAAVDDAVMFVEADRALATIQAVEADHDALARRVEALRAALAGMREPWCDVWQDFVRSEGARAWVTDRIREIDAALAADDETAK